MENTDVDCFPLFRAQVIQCLADLMLSDVLKKTAHITDACRDELKFELLQRVCRIDFFQKRNTIFIVCL
jgi:hypothetical protein